MKTRLMEADINENDYYQIFVSKKLIDAGYKPRIIINGEEQELDFTKNRAIFDEVGIQFENEETTQVSDIADKEENTITRLQQPKFKSGRKIRKEN